MTVSDGAVVGLTKVVDHGPASVRWNLVLMGDGFRASELPTFHADVSGFIARLQSNDPFSTVWSAINIYRIDVRSTDSGARDPIACGGTGATPKTYFDASFCNGNIRRLLTVNNNTALTTASAEVPEVHMAMVIVNSSEYGGSGGAVAVFSRDPQAAEIGLHEMGHTAFGFADEYEYYQGCNSGEAGHARIAPTAIRAPRARYPRGRSVPSKAPDISIVVCIDRNSFAVCGRWGTHFAVSART